MKKISKTFVIMLLVLYCTVSLSNFLSILFPTEHTVVYADNSKYLLGGENASDDQIVNVGGTNNSKWSSDGVSVSKTVDGTDTEDYFDITLQVKTRTDIKEIIDNEDVAVVIVIDLSKTMEAAVSGTSTTYSNSKAKKAADEAGNFVQKFFNASSSYPNSVLGVVGFNTNGISIKNMTHLSSQTQVNTFKTDISTKVKNTITGYAASGDPSRFTNIEAGLKMAKNMLSNCKQRHKYVVLISDGLPTTYTKTTGASDYTGAVVANLTDSINGGRNLTYGGNYSDTGAKRARSVAMSLKNSGVTIYSIGVGLSTFEGSQSTSAHTLPYGGATVYTKLNGEQMIVNQLARATVLGVSTVENTFGAISGGWTAANKAKVYGYNWEIRRNYSGYANYYWNGSGTTPMYGSLTETKSTSDSRKLFENWLKYGIGSGKYFDVNNDAGLTQAINDIFDDVNTTVLSNRAIIWTTTDPMDSVDSQTSRLSDYIEFKGFITANGTLSNGPLTGTYGANNTNTASIATSTSNPSGVITWDLKKSGYTKATEGGTSVYTFTLKYRVRLKTDKQGFVKEKAYDTNGVTTLKYVVEKNGELSNVLSVNYPIPQVKGYLTELKITKIVEGLASGKSFTTANGTFNFTVTLKQNNQSLPNTFTFAYDKYNANGSVAAANQSIASGGTITLTNGQYAIIHNLFHDISYTVSETNKDGFVKTIQSGSETGTTHSNVPLNEVTYKNKAYQLKMKKIDEKTTDPLAGVKFSLYKTYQNGVFSNVVPSMNNGLTLQNLETSSEGYIDFGNLPFTYGGSSTYYLVEEETIDKYNLLDNYVEITVGTNGITAKYNGENLPLTANGTVFEVTVPNAKGIDLPETGGMGNKVFILFGGMLVLLSVINSKVNKKEN